MYDMGSRADRQRQIIKVFDSNKAKTNLFRRNSLVLARHLPSSPVFSRQPSLTFLLVTLLIAFSIAAFIFGYLASCC